MKIPKNKKTKLSKRLQVVGTKKTGYWWNGIPCNCEFVRVRVTEQTGNYWATPFVGKARQAVKVTIPGRPVFYIDNDDGTGYIKVKHGLGAQSVFHRGIVEPEYIMDVMDVNIQQFDIVKYNAIEKEIGEWMKVAHPDMYEKSKKVREQAMFKVEKTSNAILPENAK